MKSHLLKFLRQEDGPTAVEYAVLLALIVAVCIGSVFTLSNATANSLDNSAAQLTTVFGS